MGGCQGTSDGNGGDKGNGDKKKYRSTKYDFEDMDEEESVTEDSFELEITPQQLSQVTPGGGVLKLTLSKKKPLKLQLELQVENQIAFKQQLKQFMTLEKRKGINL